MDKTHEGTGYVYAAFSEGNGVKIGVTCKDDPTNRIKQLNIAVKHAYQLIGLIRCGNPYPLEKMFHDHLKVYSVGEHNRELFDVSPKKVQELFEVTREGINTLGLTEDSVLDLHRLKGYLVFKGLVSDNSKDNKKTKPVPNTLKKRKERNDSTPNPDTGSNTLKKRKERNDSTPNPDTGSNTLDLDTRTKLLTSPHLRKWFIAKLLKGQL